MQVLVSSGGSDIVSHTLTRHQEILHDITQVFNVNGSDAFFLAITL
jgi:Golgi SNAP receptor complex protein 1